MRLSNLSDKPLLHVLIATLLSAAILFTLTFLPDVKFTAVEYVNVVLRYPEIPSFNLRNLIKYSSNWLLERASLNERVKELELKNQAMATILQKQGISIPEPRESYIRAMVTLRYPEDWWQLFRIDKGLRDGVAEGAAVTSNGFLVGKVSDVGANFAWVEMITSSSFMLSAVIDQTRDLGVINGDGMGGLKMLYIPENRNIVSGMTVSTSLINDAIPSGLPIGKVIEQNDYKEGNGEMRLDAGAHLTQLYNVEVFTIKRENKK